MKISLFLTLILTAILEAQTSKELFAKGLFSEETENDYQSASKNYEAILKAYGEEHQVAAAALYRLAEVRRKQGELKEAVKLLQKLVAKFPDVEPQQKMARENLQALGVPLPVLGVMKIDLEERELQRLKELAITSPDIRVQERDIRPIVKKGWSKVIDYLIEAQGLESLEGGLREAVDEGNLSMVKKLVESGVDPNAEEALGDSIGNGYETITQYLLSKGATLRKSDPSFLRSMASKRGEQVPTLRRALEAGADVDFNYYKGKEMKRSTGWLSVSLGTALLEAIRNGHQESAEFLLENGADPNLVDSEGDVSPLQLAVALKLPELVKALLEAGAKVNHETRRWTSIGNRLFERGQKVGIISNADIDLETLKLLVAADCPIPEKLLSELVKEGKLEQVKVLVGHGVELNQIAEGERFSPLSLALSKWNFELGEVLRENGARVSDSDWGRLPSDLSLKWNRELRYPEWAKKDVVTIVMPELPHSKRPGKGYFLGEMKPEASFLEEVLKLPFPSLFTFWAKGTNPTEFKPDKIVWNLVRGKERTVLDFASGNFPKFKAGDIVEVTGVAKKDAIVWGKSAGILGELKHYSFVQAIQAKLAGD